MKYQQERKQPCPLLRNTFAVINSMAYIGHDAQQKARRKIGQGFQRSFQTYQRIDTPAENKQDDCSYDSTHPRSINRLSLCQGIMQGFHDLSLKYSQIDNTEYREKKTARNGYDAGGSSFINICFFVIHARLCFHFSQYHCRTSRDIKFQPFLLVLLIHWVEVSEVTDAVI